MAWLYIFIAAVCEVAWTYSVKYLDFKKILAIKWLSFFSTVDNTLFLLPLLGYIVFGLANVLCFSLAIKEIPPSTVLAVWMGITLVGVKLVDVHLFKEPYNFMQLFYMLLILIGIVGLKRDAHS